MNDWSMVSTIFMIFGTAFVITTLFRDYYRDYTRNELFALRNKLFDFAATNDPSLFDQEAYRMVEQRINRSIRLLDDITLVSVIYFLISSDRREIDTIEAQTKKVNRQLKHAVEKISNKKYRKTITSIDDQVFIVSTSYLFVSSWYTVPFVLVFLYLYVSIVNILSLFTKRKIALSRKGKSTKEYVCTGVKVFQESAYSPSCVGA